MGEEARQGETIDAFATADHSAVQCPGDSGTVVGWRGCRDLIAPDPHLLRTVKDSRQVVVVGIAGCQECSLGDSGVEEQLDCLEISSIGRPKAGEVGDVAAVSAADAVHCISPP